MKIASVFLAAALAPLFIGMVNATKAFFAGKKGPGVLRLYVDLLKLLKKSPVRHAHSTWVSELSQCVSLASVLASAVIFPWCASGSALHCVPAALFFYLLGAGRFFFVLGSLDAGNAFEGMGASREMQFAALVEPIFFAVLGFLVLLTGDISLSGMLSGPSLRSWPQNAVALVLAAFAFMVAFLSENCRVPFDDPQTHLELTMIHEAMLLDVGGIDLAFALYGAALKFELLAAFLVMMVVPSFGGGWWNGLAVLLGVGAVSVLVGVVESVMARMRFLKTPQTLVGAALIAALSAFLYLSFR